MSYVAATDTSPATYEGKTAEQWRAEAQADRQRARESWERSDSDGFLSQWASGICANECLTKADLIEHDGLTEVPAVFVAATGEVASIEYREGPYGWFWFLTPEAAAATIGKRFFNPSKADKAKTRHANNLKKGFTIGTIRVRGEVKVVGKSYTSVRPIIVADEQALRDGDYEIISTDDDATDY